MRFPQPGATNVTEALAAPADGQTVGDLINGEAAIIGEKFELSPRRSRHR